MPTFAKNGARRLVLELMHFFLVAMHPKMKNSFIFGYAICVEQFCRNVGD